MLGFAIARRLSKWRSARLLILMKLAPLDAIRGNMTLNIIMLIAPVDAIRAWQAG